MTEGRSTTSTVLFLHTHVDTGSYVASCSLCRWLSNDWRCLEQGWAGTLLT